MTRQVDITKCKAQLTQSAQPLPPSTPFVTDLLLRAAQKHGGTLTVTQAVLATGLPFPDVEKCLTELSTTGYVEIENTEDGSLLFVFGDLPEPEPGELVWVGGQCGCWSRLESNLGQPWRLTLVNALGWR